jgi:dTDP-4-amino-4,6-dideoxygalactose transaminase
VLHNSHRRQVPAVTDRRIYLSPPDVGARERTALLAAFDSNWIAPTGPELDAFERELAHRLDVPYAVALSSGTAGLHVLLCSLGIGPGDTVIVPSLTFAATANAVMYVGATPVFVDCSPSTWTIDPALVECALETLEAEGRRVAAVMAVDLYGQCADYGALAPMCAERDIPIFEDAAEALGATYRGRAAGSFGRAAVFSFNGNKIITTSGGGMVVTGDNDLAKRVRYLSTQARDPVLHYEHRAVGYNYRLSNLLAALGRAQLHTLDERVRARRATYASYRDALQQVPGIEFMPLADYGMSSCWLSCLLIDPVEFGATRDAVISHLESRGIESRPTWKPMHRQPVYAGYRMVGGSVSDDVFRRGLCLPSGSTLTDADRRRVVDAVVDTPRSRHGRRPHGPRQVRAVARG